MASTLSAADLAAAKSAGFSAEEVQAELSRAPGLNVDAAIGGLAGRRTRQAAGQVSASASAPAGYGIDAGGRFAAMPTQPAPAAPAPAPAAPAPAPAAPTPAPPAPAAKPAEQPPLPVGEGERKSMTDKYVAAGYTPEDAQKRVDELFAGRPAEKGYAPGKSELASAPAGGAYKVAYGDTLTKIAQKFGLTVGELLAANPAIKDPNRIFSGQALTIPTGGSVQPFQLPTGMEYINGAQYGTAALQQANFSNIQISPDGKSLYGKRINPADAINSQQLTSFNAIETGTQDAGDNTTREADKEEKYQAEIDEILGTDEPDPAEPDSATTTDGATIDLKADDGALALYKSLLNAPEIKSLSTKAAGVQEQLDKLDASEVALANDIRKEVQGEAPQSYIDALVAERTKDLYPKKLALQAELRNLSTRLSAEKENAANVLQFTLKDEDNRYNRLFNMLQLETQKGQFADNKAFQEKQFGAQQDQQKVSNAQQKISNEIAMASMMKDLPTNRSITVNGVTYKGMSEDANLNVVQFTDSKRQITIAGIDKITGELKYKKVIGIAGGGGSGTGEASPMKTLTDYNATEQLRINKGITDGTYGVETYSNGQVIYDKTKYGDSLTAWEKGGTGMFTDPAFDTSVEHDGKTYTGKKSTLPAKTDYQVNPPSPVSKP